MLKLTYKIEIVAPIIDDDNKDGAKLTPLYLISAKDIKRVAVKIKNESASK